MSEFWLDIKDWEGIYQISSFGRIRRLTHQQHKTALKVPRILKLTKHNVGTGYLRVYLNGNKYVHRLVADAFIPNPDNKEEINHKDGNGFNNKIDNLEWVTRQQNVNHAVKTGLWIPNFGVKNGMAKLDPAKVRQIKKLSSLGLSNPELSNIFGVHRKTVLDVVNKKIWKHVE